MLLWAASKRKSKEHDDLTDRGLLHQEILTPWTARGRRTGHVLYKTMMMACLCLTLLLLLSEAASFGIGPLRPQWFRMQKLRGYYRGIRFIVPYPHFVAEYPLPPSNADLHTTPSFASVDQPNYLPYNYRNSSTATAKYEHIRPCYLDSEEKIHAPDIYAYNGIPLGQADPIFGSYNLFGMRDDVCFDRAGRLGPYKFENDAPLEDGRQAASLNVKKDLDWSRAQEQCYKANRHRFQPRSEILSLPKKTIYRTALVIRCWTGYQWNENSILTLRALINELSLKSGGEYTVHILLHVKDNYFPIDDHKAERRLIERYIPFEFRGLVTLWTESYMEVIYSTPFGKAFANPSKTSVYGVYRSLQMALQWFASEHPEYDFFWNWEMDIRYTGHYFELFDRLASWSRTQSRTGLWQRNEKHYIPALHGAWDEFLSNVAQETRPDAPALAQPESWPGSPVDFPGRQQLSQEQVSPPEGCLSRDTSLCGVGEEADLITLNPVFDPQGSGWYFEDDISGYNLSLPIPPRRASTIAATRLSRQLLTIMHKEMIEFGHSAFVEVFAPTMALHHGLKAVYAPHPVFLDRKWPLDTINTKFNGLHYRTLPGSRFPFFHRRPSPYHIADEHIHRETTWSYNSEFARSLWRRWLGFRDRGIGGTTFEVRGSGRMCLRPMLLHPVKAEEALT